MLCNLVNVFPAKGGRVKSVVFPGQDVWCFLGCNVWCFLDCKSVEVRSKCVVFPGLQEESEEEESVVFPGLQDLNVWCKI